jgi:peptidoglycan/LPS O-acetylase OafA/YrhL
VSAVDPAAARRTRQRIGFVLVALGALVVVLSDYAFGATEFFTPPRIAGFALVGAGVLVQLWVVLSRRRAREDGSV